MKFFDALNRAVEIGSWLLVITMLATGAHAATTAAQKHGNSLGVVMSFDNPNTYKAGAVVAVAYVGDRGNSGIVVRIQPSGTYSLFTEDITFCGGPEKFLNKTNPMVLTYRTKAHRTIDGVGCHELVRVDSLAPVTVKDLQ